MTRRLPAFLAGAILAAGSALALASCMGPPGAGFGGEGDGKLPAEPAGSVTSGSAQVRLQIQVMPSRYTQAIVPHYTASSIATLDVVPHLQTGASAFQPISKTTGEPTATTDPDVVKATLASPSIDLSVPVIFDNLKSNRTYRFFARAYDSGNNLISTDDASSSLVLSLTMDDRPKMGSLPLKLLDKVFGASTSVTLTGAIADKPYHHVLTELFTADGASLQPVAGGTNSVPNPFGGYTLGFTNLKPHTTYRLKASAVQATGDIIATGSVDIVITNDDAPATRSLAL